MAVSRAEIRVLAVNMPKLMKYVPARSAGLEVGVIVITSFPSGPSDRWSAIARFTISDSVLNRAYRSTSTFEVWDSNRISNRVAPVGTSMR